MLKLSKSAMSAIPSLPHKWPDTSHLLIGPRSAKEPYFFLLQSRADLDLMAVLQTPFNYSVIRTRFFKKSPQSVVAPFNERLYVLGGRAIKVANLTGWADPLALRVPATTMVSPISLH